MSTKTLLHRLIHPLQQWRTRRANKMWAGAEVLTIPREENPVDGVGQMICRWAEAKYDLTGVQRVTFEPAAHGPYSEVTPDLDLHMEIDVKLADGSSRHFEENFATDLIVDILRHSQEAL